MSTSVLPRVEHGRALGRAIVLLVLPMLAIAACAPLEGTAAPAPEVTLWGDSFGEQVAPYLAYDERVMGGTAPCDWLGDIADQPAPHTAVLLFVGNELAECDYAASVAAITRDLRSRGSRVVWIAAPHLPINPAARSALNALYPNPAHGPADSIGGDAHLPEYRAADGQHLNAAGARRFAHAIEVAVG
jgi:hypothetical protein